MVLIDLSSVQICIQFLKVDTDLQKGGQVSQEQ